MTHLPIISASNFSEILRFKISIFRKNYISGDSNYILPPQMFRVFLLHLGPQLLETAQDEAQWSEALPLSLLYVLLHTELYLQGDLTITPTSINAITSTNAPNSTSAPTSTTTFTSAPTSTPYLLQVHLRTKHAVEDMTNLLFQCGLCSFRSLKESIFLAHVVTHR